MMSCKQLIHSFLCAFSGIFFAVRHERNMRIHLVVGTYVLYFQRFYELSRVERALLFFTVGVVVAAELMNTAIENTVNLVTPSYHELAKTAKDVAAGAVLFCALVSVVVAVYLLGDWTTIQKIAVDFVGNLWGLIVLILSVFGSIWFVFFFGEPQKPLPAPKEK